MCYLAAMCCIYIVLVCTKKRGKVCMCIERNVYAITYCKCKNYVVNCDYKIIRVLCLLLPPPCLCS